MLCLFWYAICNLSCCNHVGVFNPSSTFKPRLRWTDELHDKFVDAVEKLGGYSRATPSAILKAMGVDRLELGHVKSHLQKYRTEKKRNKKDEEPEGKSAPSQKVRLVVIVHMEVAFLETRAQVVIVHMEVAFLETRAQVVLSTQRVKMEDAHESQVAQKPVVTTSHGQLPHGGADGRPPADEAIDLEAALKKQYELQQMLAEQLEVICFSFCNSELIRLTVSHCIAEQLEVICFSFCNSELIRLTVSHCVGLICSL